jgi:hypothetical protein
MTMAIESPPLHAEAMPAIPLTAADRASMDAYLIAGERMAVLLDVVWKLCVALMVLTLAAWALGMLPGAVRLF